MKITKVSCEQFAGTRDRSIELTDGINVIYGKNESGKSTLVNLISRTLFQNAKIDGRSDRSFTENYFPTAKRDGSRIANADGTVTITTGDDIYTVKKEWGEECRATLNAPDGVIRGDANVANALKDVLGYGEGVYTDILFSAQNDVYPALQSMLDASKRTETKQDILSAVSRAFAESDGVSLDTVEQKINDRINDIKGKHWDEERNVEVKARTGRWSKDLGEILKAKYAWEDAKSMMDKKSGLEDAEVRANTDYTNADDDYRKADERYQDFGRYSTALTLQSRNKADQTRIKTDIDKHTNILNDWPVLRENVQKAKDLKKEMEGREAFDLYQAAKAKKAERDSKKEEIEAKRCPEDREIKDVQTAQRKILDLENKLCGMNLTVNIRMLGGHSVELRSLRTGEPVEAGHITEAVSVIVPGVMEMQLAPANVDVAEVKKQLCTQRGIITGVYEKYGVSDADGLRQLKTDYGNLQRKFEEKEWEFTNLLGGKTFEEVEAAVPSAVRSRNEIDADIEELCKGVDLNSYDFENSLKLKAYGKEYIDQGSLKQLIEQEREKLKATEASLSEAESIPAKYRDIDNPEQFLKKLKNDLDQKRENRDAALRNKTAAEEKRENYENTLSGDPADELEKAKRAFDEQKELLSHWRHISEVFYSRKEALSNNPLVGLADDFSRYLGIISGERIVSEFPEADKLCINLYSADRTVDFGKLSEGSKETVSLAFRLAVLDHLFPEGGGVIVLDDPFANMDSERTEKSAELIKDCAARHQVIFLTCKEENPKLLGGNLIRI